MANTEFFALPCMLCSGPRNWTSDGHPQAVCHDCAHKPRPDTRTSAQRLADEAWSQYRAGVLDIWTLSERVNIPNMGEPPPWATTIVLRLQAQRAMGIGTEEFLPKPGTPIPKSASAPDGPSTPAGSLDTSSIRYIISTAAANGVLDELFGEGQERKDSRRFLDLYSTLPANAAEVMTGDLANNAADSLALRLLDEHCGICNGECTRRVEHAARIEIVLLRRRVNRLIGEIDRVRAQRDGLDDELNKAHADRDVFRESERRTAEAYLRLRKIIPGAFDTPHAPSAAQMWAHAEECARKLVESVAWAKMHHCSPPLGNPTREEAMEALHIIRSIIGNSDTDVFAASCLRAINGVVEHHLKAHKVSGT